MFDIYNLGSGSSGNATIVSDGATTFLIDCGLNYKTLVERLKETPFSIGDITFILFTHLHIDHFQPTCCKKFPSSMYYGAFTINDIPKENYLIPFQERYIHDYKIMPLLASHDDYSVDHTLGYRIENGAGEVLVYMSDTGYICEENIPFMYNANYYMLESNHDRTKLYTNPKYPPRLVDRIDSDGGHLSNSDSAMNAYYMIGPNTKKVYLIHLSKENNTPALALKEYKKVFSQSLPHRNVEIGVCKPYEVTKL